MTTIAQEPGPAAHRTAPSPELRRHLKAKRRREATTGWLFIAPFAALFLLTFIIPIVVSVKESFFRAKPSGGGLYGGGGGLVNSFVGFDNYGEVLANSAFWSGMGRVLLFGVIQIPVMIIAALGLALLLESRLVRRRGGFRLAYFLPYAIPGVIAALVWTYIYSPQMSPINQFLGLFGAKIDFFAPGTILGSMANMTTWTFTGYNMLIFLAALSAIPLDIYEAARIDGAGEWAIVRRIKIPMVSRAMMLAVLLSIIGTIQLFNEPTVLAAVNPWMGKAYTPMMMAYNSVSGQVSPSGSGPASAISILMAVAAALLAAVYALAQARSVRNAG